MRYNDLTRHHFETARHAGELTGPGTRRGSAGDRALGTWVQFDTRFDGRSWEVRFLAYGCPHVIAVSDWLAERAADGWGDSFPPESVNALQQRFDMPTEKLGRLLIVEDAWIAAGMAPYRV